MEVKVDALLSVSFVRCDFAENKVIFKWLSNVHVGNGVKHSRINEWVRESDRKIKHKK